MLGLMSARSHSMSVQKWYLDICIYINIFFHMNFPNTVCSEAMFSGRLDAWYRVPVGTMENRSMLVSMFGSGVTVYDSPRCRGDLGSGQRRGPRALGGTAA